MSALRKLIAAIAAFSYTLLYGIPYGRLAFDFLASIDRHGAELVSSADLRALQTLTAIVLHVGAVIIVVFMYEKIRGALVWAYLASLTAAFFMPLLFVGMRSRGFISFSWQFDGVVWVVINLLFGPAMVLVLGCLAMSCMRKVRQQVFNRTQGLSSENDKS